MKKIIIKQSFLAGIAIFSVAIVAPLATSAQPARAQDAQIKAEERREAEEQIDQKQQTSGNEVSPQGQDQREQNQARLETAKLKVCQNREKAITNIMARISDRGTKQLGVFSKISDRVQLFYTDQGKSFDNYDTLVSNLNAKKKAAQEAVIIVKDVSVEFKCDGDNPKAAADSFKNSLQAMNIVLKDYKTAIKDLIVGVKSAQDTTTNSTDEGSQE